MANGWSAQEVQLPVSATTLGASVSNIPVTKEYRISAGGAKDMVLKITASAAVVGAGITAKLQTAIGSDWVDSKTVAITTAGTYYIKLLAEASGDQTYLPLLNLGRVVLTTGAGSSVTVSKVELLQALG